METMLSELASSVREALVLIGTVYLIFAIATTTVLCILAFFLARMSAKFIRFHGWREVLCPETKAIALIRMDALHAAVSGAVADPELRVIGCSRWPQHQGCRQDCVRRA